MSQQFKALLLFQRAQVRFSEPTQCLTPICNSSSRGSHTFFWTLQVPVNIHSRHTQFRYTVGKNTHKHIKTIVLKLKKKKKEKRKSQITMPLRYIKYIPKLLAYFHFSPQYLYTYMFLRYIIFGPLSLKKFCQAVVMHASRTARSTQRKEGKKFP